MARDLPVPMPEAVKRLKEGSVDYPALYGPFRLPLLALVAWGIEGLKLVPAAAVRATLDGSSASGATSRT